MPAKEIKQLRQEGKLEEALELAKLELQEDPDNIWAKRNISWVLYAQLDELASNLDAFIEKINEVKELDLPASEEMFFENISIVISKAARVITHEATLDINKIHRLFDSIKELSLKRNSKWFSVLFNAMHKGMKESNRYIEFADWWDFKNFRPEDFQKEKMPNGKEVMAIAEQAYISYAKHVLPQKSFTGEVYFDSNKASEFLSKLDVIVDGYPDMQYPAYFKAKLLIALGDNESMLESLLPFARKKRSDFWVWDILSEGFLNEPEKVFACYCRGLLCKSPEDMLISLRQRFAKMLIEKGHYNEAKTEIDLLVKIRLEKGFKIPFEVENWKNQNWYSDAKAFANNRQFYLKYSNAADEILFHDVPEEMIIVDFVNTDKKILNFIASDSKYGFFKYDRYLNKVNIGDAYKVRFVNGELGGKYQIYTIESTNNPNFTAQYLKEIEGMVKIGEGKNFGFIDDVFIHSSLIKKYNLINGMRYSGKAIKNYNKEKKQWGWKLI
jgi:hypothetical protein